jgi:alpha-L-arabinofuranosidase
VTTLSGRTTLETNSISDPTHIVPVVSSIVNAGAKFAHTVPKYAVQVLDIDLD